MSSKKTPKTGIPGWTLKQAFLRALYDSYTDVGLADRVVTNWADNDCYREYIRNHLDELVDEFSTWRSEQIKKTATTISKWKKSKPTSSYISENFLRQIIEDHDLKINIIELQQCTFIQFVDFFKSKKDINAIVRAFLADWRVSVDADTLEILQNYEGVDKYNDQGKGTSCDVYSVHGHLETRFDGLQTGIENGRVQSTMIYTVPEAARAWAELVDSENYNMYLDCLLSLKNLVKTEEWNEAVKSGEYDTAIALGGGGSPEKDWVLATSMLEALGDHKKLLYCMNDISYYMLHNSARVLKRRLATEKLDTRIQIEYICRDFLKFYTQSDRPSPRPIIWAILGGTIGNVPERDFFRSINGPSKTEDLLVIGIDTIANDQQEPFEKRMRSTYRSKEVDAFLCVPLKGHVAEREDSESPIEMTIEAYREGSPSNLSDVPNSRTAVFSFRSNIEEGKRIALPHSTRYVIEDFLAYAKKFGWNHLASIPASSDSTFRQILLRRYR